jgi:hypothetical protein
MNARTSIGMALLLALAAAATAHAQGKPGGPKLYRWVDKQGKVHFDDALPPEAVNQARKEFNASNGTTVGVVDRALTPEERAALAAAAVAQAQAQKGAVEQQRLETIMMASYETEMDLRRAYGERIGLLKTTIDSTDISIKSLNDNLASMLAQASDTELDNRRVLEDRQKMIRDLHVEKLKQEALQRGRRGDLVALNAEFARMLARYRELRAAAAATAAPATAPGAAAPPVGG